MFDCDIIKNRKSSRRYLYDVYLLAAIILLALIWLLINNLKFESGNKVRIQFDNNTDDRGVVYYNIDPDETHYLLFFYDESTAKYVIRDLYNDESLDQINEYNVIRISPDGVKVTEANCNDLTCVHTKQATKDGESIICLPHRLIIVMESSEAEDGLDAVTW